MKITETKSIEVSGEEIIAYLRGLGHEVPDVAKVVFAYNTHGTQNIHGVVVTWSKDLVVVPS